MKHHLLVSLTAAMLLAACTTIGAAPDDQERGRLSTKMVNLSSAVDAYFSDLAEAPIDTDLNILQSATKRDPRLLAPDFEPYLLKVQYQKAYAVLLLCTKDGQQAIMEDAGCSARLDRQVTGTAPCKFTLVIKPSCQVNGADPQ